MKILIVGTVKTHPIRMGNMQLIVEQCIFLEQMGHEVHYLYIQEGSIRSIGKSIHDDIGPMMVFWKDRLHICPVSYISHFKSTFIRYINMHFKKGYSSCDYAYHNCIHRKINELDKLYRFDCCIVNYYYLSKALSKISISKKALLTHDCYTYRTLRTNMKVVSLKPNEEAKALQRADYILSVQQNESIFFNYLSPKSKVLTIYANISFKSYPITYNRTILYLAGNGKFNLNGINWFIKDIFPKILKCFPDVKLLIGGKICDELYTLDGLCDNIELLGSIDDIDDFFSKGDVFINPTYQGTGLKIKTIESIARNKITLVHPHSLEGIYEYTISPVFSSSLPEEWLKYLELVWGDPTFLRDVREKNRDYITKMNTFIQHQYDDFLR